MNTSDSLLRKFLREANIPHDLWDIKLSTQGYQASKAIPLTEILISRLSSRKDCPPNFVALMNLREAIALEKCSVEYEFSLELWRGGSSTCTPHILYPTEISEDLREVIHALTEPMRAYVSSVFAKLNCYS